MLMRHWPKRSRVLRVVIRSNELHCSRIHWLMVEHWWTGLLCSWTHTDLDGSMSWSWPSTRNCAVHKSIYRIDTLFFDCYCHVFVWVCTLSVRFRWLWVTWCINSKSILSVQSWVIFGDFQFSHIFVQLTVPPSGRFFDYSGQRPCQLCFSFLVASSGDKQTTNRFHEFRPCGRFFFQMLSTNGTREFFWWFGWLLSSLSFIRTHAPLTQPVQLELQLIQADG